MTRRHGLAVLALVVLVGLACAVVARRAMEPQAAIATLSAGYLTATALDARTHRAFIEMAAYVPGSSSHLDVLDTTSGRLVRARTIGSSSGGLAIDDHTNRAFVVDGEDNSLRVLDARSGALLHTVALLNPVSDDSAQGPTQGIAVDTHTNRIFVTSDPLNRVSGLNNPGSVIELDARSGRVLRTIPCGASSDALLMDEQAGRHMALCAASPAQPTDAWSWIPRGIRRWLHLLPTPRPTSGGAPEIVHMLDATR